MTRPRPTRLLLACFALAALSVVAPATLAAQRSADFLFERPVVSLTVRGGYALARTGGEIFDFTTEQLTLNESDFNAASIGGELAWRATERLDVALSVDYARSETASEFRKWVDLNDNPITQTTTFWRAPVMLSVKGYLFERGRSVSRFAWVPTASWSPYVGAGVGYTWYGFQQQGDFVDFETLDIFYDRFASEGKAPTAQVLGGTRFSLGEMFGVTAEARYLWASDELGSDFGRFDEDSGRVEALPIDLGGLQGSVGLSIRF